MKKRLLALLLVLCMILGMAPQIFAAEPEPTRTDETEPVAAEAAPEELQTTERNLQAQELTLTEIDPSVITADLTLDSAVAEIEPNADEPVHAATDPVRVVIVMDSDAAIIAGFSTASLADNAQAMAFIDAQRAAQKKVTADIEAQALGGKTLDVKWNLTLAMNAIAAEVPYGAIEAIKKVSGVKAVYEDIRYDVPDPIDLPDEPTTVSATGMVGRVEAAELGYTGAGQLVAVIDTGLDTDHQSFDAGAFLYSLGDAAPALLDADGVNSVLSRLNAAQRFEGLTAEQLYLSAKIPYGFNYVDKSLNVTHDYDAQGDHGTHVSGIAAANRYVPAGDGYVEQPNGVIGVAPDAQLLVMKVFGAAGGAYATDYMAAIEDALLLGADAVNLSLGSAYPGFTSAADEYLDGVLASLVGSDTVVSISCGNNGSWADNGYQGTGLLFADDVSMNEVGSPGSYTNSLAVASVNNAAVTGNYLEFNGSFKATYTETSGYGNDSILTLDTTGEGTSYEYVLLEGIGVEEDYADVDVSGKIVLVSRGQTNFADKVNIAAAHGAIAVVVYNNQPGVINMQLTGVTTATPAVAITKAAKETIAQSGSVGTVRITGEVASIEAEDGWTMSSFSSWGVPGDLSLKPEITAPGGNIYSSLNNNAYGIMSGTSMAAPSVTGGSAVVAQYIAENGLAAKTGLPARTLMQSLLMASAVPLTDPNSGVEYSPRQQGAGLMNVYDAVSAGAYILVGDKEGNDGKVKLELGDDPARTGEYELAYTIYNFSENDKEYVLSASVLAPAVETIEGYKFLSKSDRALAPKLTWSVSGVYRYDVNGDGEITRADAEALMAFAAGKSELTLDDRYDFNSDGAVNTADVRIYLESLAGDTSVADVFARAVTVPAGGSLPVTAILTLGAEDVAYLTENFVNGTYVEGYLYAAEPNGVTLSVPFLAFWGNWTDPSMFDKWYAIMNDQGVDNVFDAYNEATGSAYTYAGYANLFVWYPTGNSKDGEFVFTANPYATDDAYLPDRNAVSSSAAFTYGQVIPIRNSAYARMFVSDAETGEAYFEQEEFAQGVGFCYISSQGRWMTGFNSTGQYTSYSFTDRENQPLPEGSRLEIGYTLLPEYYLAEDGTLDPGKTPGPGATFSVPFAIDNTPPVIESATGASDLLTGAITGDLTLKVSDNRYVAAVVVLNEFGSEVLARYAVNQTEPGVTTELKIPAPQVPENEGFMLLVGDYAGLGSAYVVNGGSSGGSSALEVDQLYALSYGGDYGVIMRMDVDPEAGSVTQETLFRLGSGDYTVSAYGNGYLYAVAESVEDLGGSYKHRSTLYALDLNARREYKIADIEASGYSRQWYAGMGYDPTSGLLYLAAHDGTLYSIDPYEGIPQAVAKLGNNLRGFTVDREGKMYALLFTTTTNENFLSFQVVDGAVVGLSVSNVTRPFSYEFNLAECQLYAEGNRLLAEFDPRSVATTQLTEEHLFYSLDLDALEWTPLGEGKMTAGMFKLTGNPAEKVTLSETALTMLLNQTTALTALVSPWTATDRTVTWSSDNEEVAAVSEDGTVTAIAAGTATVTAASNSNPEVFATCEVTVLEKDLQTILFAVTPEHTGYWAYWSAVNGVTKITDSETIYDGAALVNGYIWANREGTSTVDIIDPLTMEVTATTGYSGTEMAYLGGDRVGFFQPVNGSEYYINYLDANTHNYINYLEGINNSYATTGATYLGTWTKPNNGKHVFFLLAVDDTGSLGLVYYDDYTEVYGVAVAGYNTLFSHHSLAVDSAHIKYQAAAYDFSSEYLLYSYYDGAGYAHMEAVQFDNILRDYHGQYIQDSLTYGKTALCLGEIGDGILYAPAMLAMGYTVTFDSMGGSEVESAFAPTFGLKVEEPEAPTKEGYEFCGWYTENTAYLEKFDFENDAVRGDMTLYALWKPEGTHLVTFESNGGTPVPAAIAQDGEPVARPEDPAKSGYRFTDWYSDPELTTVFDFTTPITADLTLYAGYLSAVFVDTINGSDENTGYEDSPVKTIEKALELLRADERNMLWISTYYPVIDNDLVIDGSEIDGLTISANSSLQNPIKVLGGKSLTTKAVLFDFRNNNSWLDVSSGSAELQSGTVINNSQASYIVQMSSTGEKTINLNGGSIGTEDNKAYGGVSVANGTLTVNNGEIYATGYCIFGVRNAAPTVLINGGLISSEGTAIYMRDGVATLTGGTVSGTNYSIYSYYNKTRAGTFVIAPASAGALTLNGKIYAFSYSGNTKGTLTVGAPLAWVNTESGKLPVEVRTWTDGAVLIQGTEDYTLTADDLARIEVTNPSGTMELALNDNNQIVMQTKASGDAVVSPGAITPTRFSPANAFPLGGRWHGEAVTDEGVLSVNGAPITHDANATLTLAEAESGICLADVTLSLAGTGMGDNGKVTVTWPEALTLESAEPGAHLEGSVYLIDTETPEQLTLWWAKAGTVAEPDALLNLRFTGEAGEYTLHFDVAELGEAVGVEDYDLAAELLPAPHEHTYGEPVWTWNEDFTEATAKFTCTENDDEQLLTAEITEAVTKEAEAHIPGQKTLTAKVSFNGVEYTDVKTLEIEALPCPCAAFEDMPAYGTPEHEAIDWAYTHEPIQITSGMTETTFGVGKTLTRGQAATFLYAAAGRPEFDVSTATKTFSDVPEGKYYTKAVLWAASEGLVDGYSDGTFKPEGTLTRGQILVILYAQAGKPDVTIDNPYTDVPAGKWYTKPALWAYENGIEKGVDGKFEYKTPCTREAFVLYLYRQMEGKALAE